MVSDLFVLLNRIIESSLNILRDLYITCILNVQSHTTEVIAMMTILYTIGTFLLWMENRRMLKLAIDEFKITQQRIRSEIATILINSHRDIYRWILNNDELIDIIHGGDRREFKTEFLSSLLIGLLLQTFYYHTHGFIDDDTWNIILKDAKELFTWRIIREFWERNKELYPKDFRDTIEKNIIKSITSLA